MSPGAFLGLLIGIAQTGRPSSRDLEEASRRQREQAERHHREMLDALRERQSTPSEPPEPASLWPAVFPVRYPDKMDGQGYHVPDTTGFTPRQRALALSIAQEDLDYLRRANDRKVKDYGRQ